MLWRTNEPQNDKTNKMICAPSEDSDQPGHLPSPIRVFAVCMKKSWVLSYPLSTQRRFWSDWADAQAIKLGRCPGWSESSLGVHAILLVLSCCGSNTVINHGKWLLFVRQLLDPCNLQGLDLAIVRIFQMDINEPRHEKTCLWHMRTTKVQINLRILAVWIAPLLFAA